MNKLRLRKLRRRALSWVLALSMLIPTFSSLPMNLLRVYADNGCTLEHNWTGLVFNFTNLPAIGGGALGWPRKTYFALGTGEYQNFAGHYVFCIANHTNGQVDCGTEATMIQNLTVNDWSNYKGFNAAESLNPERTTTQEDQKFAFCLVAASVMWSYRRTTPADVTNPMSGTAEYALPHSMLVMVEGRRTDLGDVGHFTNKDDKAGNLAAFMNVLNAEFGINSPTSYGRRLDKTLTQEVVDASSSFFDEVWAAAEVMYSSIGEEPSGTVANIYKASSDPSDPDKCIVTIKCGQSAWDTYFSSIKMDTASAANYSLVASKYDAATQTGTWEFKQKGSKASDINFTFTNEGYLTDLSKPVLTEFNFCSNGHHQDWQTMFSAYYVRPTMTILTTASKTPSGGGGGGGKPKPGIEGSVELEVHRYKHSEMWQSTYNVDLLKLDSETGKPLSGSEWDILEYDTLGSWEDAGTQLGATYLDHPASEASNIGTKYNWANDKGTQFTRWEENEEDPCFEDRNMTGADGYLYDEDSNGSVTGSKAHSDSYNYTYTKGYCTGHPKPVVTHYEGNGEDVEEKNAELEEIAEKAWQEQVDYCAKLAAEGGFFHTAEESISDAAKNEMQADRDEFFKNFISLTYDYSATERNARNGYILHGTHTDDIPIERVVIHSSEYLNLISGASGGGGSSQDTDTDTDTDDTEEYSLNSAVKSVSDDDMSNEEIAAHIESVTVNNIENAETTEATASNVKADDALDVEVVNNDVSDNDVDEDVSEISAQNEENSILLAAMTYDNENVATPGEYVELQDISDEEDDLDYLSDMELVDDYEVFDEDEDDATPSEFDGIVDEVEVEKKTLWNMLVEGFRKLTASVANFVTSLLSVSDENEEVETVSLGTTNGARYDTEPPKTDGVVYIGAINFEQSEVASHASGTHNIEGWTFIAYDHRTEGEIHFNKRDLDLKGKEGDSYDAYSDANGDGTLEGAVYGLFASADIVHPDSDGFEENERDTGIVYKKGDLVAIATTDRDGNASFMTFTEEPGQTYDYETGSVVGHDGWTGPTNLHRSKETADAAVKDNEKFYGWNTEGSAEVSLTDSDAVDATYYRKHSSNQGLNLGKDQDDGTTYPISNNEDNNGNCWIGRPLIVSGTSNAQYYIKELSRSEGYELSVYGTDLTLSNREAFLAGGDTEVAEGNVSFTSVTDGKDDDDKVYNEFIINAVDTVDGFTVTAKDMTISGDNATFYTTERVPVQKKMTVTEKVITQTPVMATEGEAVLINGEMIEASIGDSKTLPNGETLTVNNVFTEAATKFYTTKNSVPYSLPNADAVNDASGDSLLEKYNNALSASNFGVPSSNAPWVFVEKGSTDQESFNNLTATLSKYAGFHQMRIVWETSDIYQVQYDFDGEAAIYDIGNQLVWIKHNISYGGVAGYIYAMHDATALTHNSSGFIVNEQTVSPTEVNEHTDLDEQVTFNDVSGKTYWAYADGEQARNSDGSLKYADTITFVEKEVTYTVYESRLTAIDASKVSYDADSNTYNITFDNAGTYLITVKYNNDNIDGQNSAYYADQHARLGYYISPKRAGSYVQDVVLTYPGQNTIYEAAKTDTTPVSVVERPIRQQVKVSKDTNTLPETLKVWYCANDGVENDDASATCAGCGRARTVEETRSIDFAHDTYTQFFNEDLSKQKQETNWIERLKNWLKTLAGVTGSEDSSKAVANFRFKSYLKSNLERLYRNEDGIVLWVDRNGNDLTPNYIDTNGDGLYETFTWNTYNGVEDFPEKDKTDDGSILSVNVQQIYTKAEHDTGSKTTSSRTNNVWSGYDNPEITLTGGIAERNNFFNTNERSINVINTTDAVNVNEALYSYVGDNINVLKTDTILANQNTGYTRLLEMTPKIVENGAGETVTVDEYNYEKFFDAIAAANTDKWDDNIETCTFNYNGYDTPVGKISMNSYPGQLWEDTLLSENQKGDVNNSFDLFRWIHKDNYGSIEEYQQYGSDFTGENVETTTSTSDYAKANAEASNAVRQFAVKWYLKEEVGKLVKNNGVGDGEDIAKTEAEGGAPGITEEGVVPYDDYIHDYGLFLALQKAYNYLRPFYENDLDTIYAIEWDSAKNGGNDEDITTLSTDIHEEGAYYNASAYLPYGTYVVVEQTPINTNKKTGYDLVNRAFNIEKPKEVLVPSVYDAESSNDTTDNYDTHYSFDITMSPEDQAKSSNYLIRFSEEWQDENQRSAGTNKHVIRAHGYYGDFEVFKYGLDVDKIGKETGSTINANGGYAFSGFTLTQSVFDPLKDYYSVGHNGESKNGAMTKITVSEGGSGNNAERYPLSDLWMNNTKTANGTGKYDVDSLINRFFYASISEDNGFMTNVLFKGGLTDDNNASGMQFKNVKSVTGELTAYNGKYAQMLVPWTVTAPADITNYSSTDFTSYADVNERNSFTTATLTIRKVDGETGEAILFDSSEFAIYAASRYTTEKEIEKDAEKLSGDEKVKFLSQFKPGDTKFYMEDTRVYGSKEFLESMGAYDITYALSLDKGLAKRYGGHGYTRVTEAEIKNVCGENGYTKITGTIEYGVYHLDTLYGISIPYDEEVTWYYSVYNTDSPICVGTIPKGTPICSEKNTVILLDDFGVRQGMLKSYSTLNDVLMEDEDHAGTTSYHLQNTGYMRTPQPLGSGCYVLAETKTPMGYLRAKPEAHEIYSGVDYYYDDGDMFKKVAMVDYEKRIDQSYSYGN